MQSDFSTDAAGFDGYGIRRKKTRYVAKVQIDEQDK
jgi:hypothetical protein